MARRYLTLAGLMIICTAVNGCSQSSELADSEASHATALAFSSTDVRCETHSATGIPLFGDLHVHTSYSFDAAANSTGATPRDAYRYARGEPIPFFPLGVNGEPVGQAQIDRPLDFMSVTDHGEFLGERSLCRTPGSPAFDTPFCQNFRSSERQGMLMLGTVITTETPQRIEQLCGPEGEICLEFAKTPWQNIQKAANEANDPCAFTSFIGYEYTGTPGTSNYHRNVIFRNEDVPPLPVSYIDAPIDSQLWSALDAVCDAAAGCDYLTIPHNTNLSNGRMAPYRKLTLNLANKRAYAKKRLQREPIMEIFQHKGGSECINGLSTIFGAPDELCAIESVRRLGEDKTYVTRTRVDGKLIQGQASEITQECHLQETGANGMLGAGCVHATDFQRSALLVGLQEQQATGLNPIKLGIIASTDTHSANPGGVSENKWQGAVTGEASPAQRLQPGLLTSGIDGNPGGLAGVWAPENTRNAIFDAMLRREVFGTSGPRIAPRLFGGWSFENNLCDASDRASAGYAGGVPMGGDLTIDNSHTAQSIPNPKLLAYAAKDPRGHDLESLQLIKGWIGKDGTLRTDVIPVAENLAGAATLCAVYEDEDFDPTLPTYYYLRVVEPETPRWHTYDCATIPKGEQPAVCSNGKYPELIREMAWTSPIWYQPD